MEKENPRHRDVRAKYLADFPDKPEAVTKWLEKMAGILEGIHQVVESAPKVIRDRVEFKITLKLKPKK